MLTPSYSQLMETIQEGEKLDSRVTSRYTVVLAAAKRARQITDGANPLTYAPTDRAVSIAVKEMSEGKLRIKIQDSLLDEDYIRLKKDPFRYRTAVSKDDLREDLKEDYMPISYDMDADDDRGEIFPTEESEETAPVAKDVDDLDIYEDTGDDADDDTDIADVAE
ncbi:MAG: DNA-directed RNA polymerase subunit omega [Defluviitaleaceae bacterium]|nr:DNA-directed RNA polymerase subunit omega [Defluviitaleaceae bacterium]